MDTTRIIDIHNHSLPLVDDGASSYEVALENIEYLSNLGIKDIVLTSHYIYGTEYTKNVQERTGILENLKSMLNRSDIDLYLGNEVFINDAKTLKRLLQESEITTLNKSRYLLIEFPIRQRLQFIESTICNLNEMGITPIIAHPERYTYIQDDFNKIYNLLDYDCLLQCNILSFIGCYGPKAKKTIKRLLKENLVSFLATDIHRVPKKDDYTKAIKRLTKKITKEKFKKLTFDNPSAVLKNEIIKDNY